MYHVKSYIIIFTLMVEKSNEVLELSCLQLQSFHSALSQDCNLLWVFLFQDNSAIPEGNHATNQSDEDFMHDGKSLEDFIVVDPDVFLVEDHQSDERRKLQEERRKLQEEQDLEYMISLSVDQQIVNLSLLQIYYNRSKSNA